MEKPQLLKYWGVYKNLSLSPSTPFMFASLDISSSPFPPRPLLPIICQKLCRFLSLKNTLQSEFTHRLPPPPPHPLCTFLLSCLKVDDLNLIWRCNAFQTVLRSRLRLCLPPPSLKVDLTARCSELSGDGGYMRVCALVVLVSNLWLVFIHECMTRALRCMCW